MSTVTTTPPKLSTPPAIPAPASCANTGIVPAPGNTALVASAVICLVNQQRAHAGLVTLAESPVLDSTAQGHSRDMVSQNYFATVAPPTAQLKPVATAVIATAGAVFDIGETIGAGSGPLASPAEIVANLMTSTPAADNPILDPDFRVIGSGVVAGLPAMLGLGSPGATYTEVFATADH